LHDVHGPWEYQGLEKHCALYNQGSSLLHSEFGVEGVTNLNTLRQVIAPAHLYPFTLDNPLWYHLGAWWVKEADWRAAFGDLREAEQLVQATQWMQADGLRYAVEADRRRAFQNSGTLPWQFNEPFPMAACTSAADYYGHPKPAYYAVAGAYAPLRISARFDRVAWHGHERFEAEVWAMSLPPAGDERVLTWARLVDLRGQEYASRTYEGHLRPDGAVRLGSLGMPLATLRDDLFFLDLRLSTLDGSRRSENRYLFSRAQNMAPMFSLPPASVRTVRETAAGGDWLTLSNVGPVAAFYLWLEQRRPVAATGWMFAKENYFCLFPGESRSVLVEWQDVSPQERKVALRGWNVAEVEI
jgi:beta-mannosidase